MLQTRLSGWLALIYSTVYESAFSYVLEKKGTLWAPSRNHGNRLSSGYSGMAQPGWLSGMRIRWNNRSILRLDIARIALCRHQAPNREEGE